MMLQFFSNNMTTNVLAAANVSLNLIRKDVSFETYDSKTWLKTDGSWEQSEFFTLRQSQKVKKSVLTKDLKKNHSGNNCYKTEEFEKNS